MTQVAGAAHRAFDSATPTAGGGRVRGRGSDVLVAKADLNFTAEDRVA